MILFRLCAWLPLLHVLLAAALFWRLPWATALGFFAIWLYLIVPLLCRLLLRGVPLDGEPLDQDSRGFKLWWFSSQLQCIFDRLTFLDEILRLVPGLYSAWLHYLFMPFFPLDRLHPEDALQSVVPFSVAFCIFLRKHPFRRSGQ